MSSIRRRKKASDVFSESTPLLGRKVRFGEAFPSIEDISVRVVESGRGVYSSGNEPSTAHYGKESLGEYIDCSNSLCYNGGFSIGRFIRRMVSDKVEHTEGSEICRGYEGSPKGRRKYGKCMNHFSFEVDIKYKSDSEGKLDQ